MKRNSIPKKPKRFTLIELLVSLSVLVIILGFVLQLFIGTQKVWTSLSQRNDVYADARVAMDLMTTTLQSAFYSDGGIPFYIDNSAANQSKLYFCTESQTNLPGNSALKYVSFQYYDKDSAGERHQLRLSVFCDLGTGFANYFPPYHDSPIDSFKYATTGTTPSNGIVNILNANLTNAIYGSVLIRRVVGFSVTPYNMLMSLPGIKQGVTSGITDPSDLTDPHPVPYMVVLKVTILSPADYKIWTQITDSTQKSEYLTEHQYTFTRGVYLGEQPRLNINE